MSSLIIRALPEIILNKDDLYEGQLVDYSRIIFREARNVNHGYHNFRHMFHVFYMCYQACVYYKDELSPRQMRELLIGSLFHDFDHTGRQGDDDLNIEYALRGLRKHLSSSDKPLEPAISGIIKASQYPYVNSPDEMLTLPARILRDADMSQTFSPVWIQQVVFGLASEWGLSPAEVLKEQTTFIGKIQFHTAWGRDLFPEERIKEKIQEATSLLVLLTDE